MAEAYAPRHAGAAEFGQRFADHSVARYEKKRRGRPLRFLFPVRYSSIGS